MIQNIPVKLNFAVRPALDAPCFVRMYSATSSEIPDPLNPAVHPAEYSMRLLVSSTINVVVLNCAVSAMVWEALKL